MNCYKFPDKESFRALAEAEGLLTEDGSLILASHTHALVEVGTITKGGSYGPAGEVIEPPTVLEGFHVNTIGLAPEAWDPYLCIVNNAVNVFAGGPTQAPATDVLEKLVA